MQRFILCCLLVSQTVWCQDRPPFTDITNLPPIAGSSGPPITDDPEIPTTPETSEVFTRGANTHETSGLETDVPLADRIPRITTAPRNVTVPVGGTAQFFCAASGYPNPHLVIVRDNNDYAVPDFSPDFDSVTSDSKPKIEQLIDPVTDLDEGWYKCIAANYYGSIVTRAYLNVSDLCENVKCPEPKVCKQDYNLATATCECPVFSCELNYDPVCGSDCEVHFNPCLWNETSCQNDYDTTSILGKGESCPATTQPEITLLTFKDIVLNEGEQFTLKAAVSGFPLPTVQWHKVDDEGNFVEVVGYGTEMSVPKTEINQTGRYVARATNCQTRNVVSRSVFVDIRAIPEPVQVVPKVPVSVCNIFGDPHVYTFDSWTFHFAGECTYVLAMDCNKYNWIIYGDMKPCGAGSCLDSVTLYINFKPIQIMRGWIINIDGNKSRFYQGEPFEIEGIEFIFDGMNLRGRYESAGLTIIWDGFTSVQIAIDQNKEGDTCGICGNNDKNLANEADQATKLYEKSLDSMEPNRYGHNWKVDRSGICPLSANIEFDVNEPCGTNYGKSLAAKEHCQAFIENPAVLRCKESVDLKFYYQSCLYDYCHLNLLRESNDPFDDNKSLSIDVVCSITRTYVNHCSLKGVSMRGWDVYMDCPIVAAQEAILSISCPQVTSPLIRT